MNVILFMTDYLPSRQPVVLRTHAGQDTAAGPFRARVLRLRQRLPGLFPDHPEPPRHHERPLQLHRPRVVPAAEGYGHAAADSHGLRLRHPADLRQPAPAGGWLQLRPRLRRLRLDPRPGDRPLAHRSQERAQMPNDAGKNRSLLDPAALSAQLRRGGRAKRTISAPARSTRPATGWNATRTRQFFLYMDLFDPHEPWDAPQHYVDLYEPERWQGPRSSSHTTTTGAIS